MTEDPTVTLWKLISNNWDVSNTSLADTPEIQTGWYDRGQKLPAICLTGGEEGAINGGDTGYTGWNPSNGMGVQRLSGAVTIDCVAGTREDCKGIASGGGDLNPKKVRWELYEEVARILMTYQTGGDLRTLAPGEGTSIVDENAEVDTEPVYRRQLRVKYVRDR